MHNDKSDTQSLPDSSSLCDSCHLLAHALIGPQNHHAQHTLCLMMETHLKVLQAALNLLIPEHHQPIALPANDGLFDDVELEPAELCDQCFALNYTLLMLSDKWVKEVIAFVLWERLEMLRRSLCMGMKWRLDWVDCLSRITYQAVTFFTRAVISCLR